MNRQLIQQIESELNQAKVAADQTTFEKHMYAVQTLAAFASTVKEQPASSPVISSAELKMMGGTPELKEQKAKTDDGFGNGESLFDF